MTSSVASSFSELSSSHPSILSADSDEDEIVWSLSDSEISTESSLRLSSDDDFIVLSRQRSQAGCSPSPLSNDSESIITGISALSLSVPEVSSEPPSIDELKKAVKEARKLRKKRSRAKRSKVARSTNGLPHSASTTTLTKAIAPKSSSKKAASKQKSPPAVPEVVVDASVQEERYKEATKRITSYLADPSSQPGIPKLTILHDFIVEFGLSSSGSTSTTLPRSINAAKALLKSRVFVNITEYIAVREQGQAVLQRILHPSRKALLKDIRKKKNPAPLQWVKQMGLNVLLVTGFH